MDVVYFRSAEEFRAWLEQHHDTATEVWVGYFNKRSGKAGLTHAEALDQALCYGWIDGIRRSVDADRFANRFTPRRRGSNWSNVNTKRVGELTDLGLMRPPGLAAFAARDGGRSGVYSFEQRAHELGDEYEAAFRANPAAWDFFAAQPPGYRRIATWWVVSAKREETRRRRLATLIEDSAHGRRLAMLARERGRG